MRMSYRRSILELEPWRRILLAQEKELKLGFFKTVLIPWYDTTKTTYPMDLDR